MLIEIIATILKICLLASVAAIEWSVAFPVISITLLFLFLRGLSLVWQSILLVTMSLILSAFTTVPWSIIFLILASTWVVIEILQEKITRIKNRVFLLSIGAVVLISWLAGAEFTTRTIIYTTIFVLVAYALTRFFFHKKNRQKFVEWLSIGM